MNNSLNQYIELFEAQRGVIDSHSCEAINRHRDAAADTLRRLGRLPRRGDEGFEKIDINEIFAPDYGLNISRVDFPLPRAEAARCEIPSVSCNTAVVVNDTCKVPDGLADTLPAGVEVMTLAEGARRYPDAFAGADPIPADNAVAALNSLLVQDGVYVRVAPGAVMDRPVQILSLFNSAQPMMGVRRIRVDVGVGARASVLACDHPPTDAASLACRVVEVNVGSGARLDYYDLEEAGAKSDRVQVLVADQQQDSTLSVCSISLKGGRTRNEFYPRHHGTGCTTRLNGLVIAGGEQIVDNATFITHCWEHCTSEQVFKYALFDRSRGAFEGLVTVAEGARFTDAHQTNRNLLASPDATMHAMPQLIINCDEVKASHGAATGQLDENALFYMRQRGIPLEQARMMLINAFMTDVLDSIDVEPLRQRLRHLVEMRLQGCEHSCASCK